VSSPDNKAANLWVLACASRLISLDKSLTTAEAIAIAESLRSLERSCELEPQAAADLAAEKIRNPMGVRFERRIHSGRSTRERPSQPIAGRRPVAVGMAALSLRVPTE
jgi:hypothetical protein